MECPKCQAQNADEAVFCSLCYETFKPKTASTGDHYVAVPRFDTHFENFDISGSFILKEDGFYFFVRTYVKAAKKEKGFGSMVGEHFGLVGGLLGAAFDSLTEKPPDPRLQPKPFRLSFQPAYKIYPQFKEALRSTGENFTCDHYFFIPKREIKEMKFNFAGHLAIKTHYYELTLTQGLLALDHRDKIEAFLTFKRFPLI